MSWTSDGWSTSIGGEEVLRRVDRALSPVSCEQYIRIQNYRFGKPDPTVVIYLAKQEHDRQVALLVEPESLRQRAVLRDGSRVLVQDPDRPSARQSGLPESSFGGGVVNNSDVLRTDYGSEYDATLVSEDQESYRLLLEARDPASIANHIALKVDRQRFIPLQEDQYNARGALIKRIEYKGLITYPDGLVRPSLARVTSPLNRGHVSEMFVGDIQARHFSKNFNEDTLQDVGALLR
ncbi:MAG: outer membrane lipoprotein-sorting protein [Magnetococcales bacterium]|nr:outer membrane lipoprotein-sorting protein [Magnetococcales bacterium]